MRFITHPAHGLLKVVHGEAARRQHRRHRRRRRRSDDDRAAGGLKRSGNISLKEGAKAHRQQRRVSPSRGSRAHRGTTREASNAAPATTEAKTRPTVKGPLPRLRACRTTERGARARAQLTATDNRRAAGGSAEEAASSDERRHESRCHPGRSARARRACTHAARRARTLIPAFWRVARVQQPCSAPRSRQGSAAWLPQKERAEE